jgi:hypothetical protein
VGARADVYQHVLGLGVERQGAREVEQLAVDFLEIPGVSEVDDVAFDRGLGRDSGDVLADVFGETAAMSSLTYSARRTCAVPWIITKRSTRKSSCIVSATEGRHFIQREGPNLEASRVEPIKPMTVSGFIRQIDNRLYTHIQIALFRLEHSNTIHQQNGAFSRFRRNFATEHSIWHAPCRYPFAGSVEQPGTSRRKRGGRNGPAASISPPTGFRRSAMTDTSFELRQVEGGVPIKMWARGVPVEDGAHEQLAARRRCRSCSVKSPPCPTSTSASAPQ